MQEFPKCLYLGGDVEAKYVLAWNADEEKAFRADGFSSAGEGVKPSLLDEAFALGIKVDKRWGDDRLAAEIAKAKA